MADFNITSVNFNEFSGGGDIKLINGGQTIGDGFGNFTDSMDFQGIVAGGTNLGAADLILATTIEIYVQRIFDITLNKFVYYKLANKTDTPGVTQTTPNHTGNLLASSYEVVLISRESI